MEAFNQETESTGKATDKKLLTPLASGIVSIALAHAVAALIVVFFLVSFMLFFLTSISPAMKVVVYGASVVSLYLFAMGVIVIFRLTKTKYNTAVAALICASIIIASPITWFLVNWFS